ncbi:hypothetical protein CEY00_Acc27605 [Actinidia chinensis var. chinensis]|uniref:Uncharacterized protein n=1 Tax=Actinidia chinensis var. chinensis TaxID=1590841 RepID=A0A2R6PL08_ACTCC|nr:hypothetical protein CEY00_Acc27605 [Actinidia chinensis var. chinensis]
MEERPLYRSELEIRVRIFRRDFRATQLKKCTPGEISGDELGYRGGATRRIRVLRSSEENWRNVYAYIGECQQIAALVPISFLPNSWSSSITFCLSKCSLPLAFIFVFVVYVPHPDVVNSGDQDSLPSWISDHLGEGSSYMTDEVNQSPASPMEGSPVLDTNPLAAIHPSVEEKTNIMTLEELNALRETYSFPSRVWVRLPEEGETIISIRPGEVAFYEAAFPAGLHFFIHPTIRLILQFYNIFLAQLVTNAGRSITCSMAMWRVFKYTLSLSEFRNLFILNSNPKPDQGWLYFKARNKKTLLGGYPSNVKGWKSKFFFVSSNEWEFPEGSSREGALRVLKTWGVPDKHCNNPPRLYGDEPKVFEEIFRSVEKTGHFSILVLLESKSFCWVFVSPGSMTSRTAGEGRSGGEAPSSSSDVGESRPSHEHVRQQSPSRDDSIECLGSIRTKLRRILPHIPDLTLLRISFKNLGEKLGKLANVSSGTPAPVKGVVIVEKRVRESLASSPSKKGKVDDGSKGKEVDHEPESKKKVTSSSKAPTTLATTLSRPEEGTLANLSTVLGPTTSILGSPSVAKKLLRGVIPPADKEKVEKLTLDQTATKLFHVIGQQLVEAQVRKQQANDELAKTKSDRDSLDKKVKRLGVLVVELREALDKAKESIVDEFKSSSEFVVAVEDSAFKYFGEGFDFCKV